MIVPGRTKIFEKNMVSDTGIHYLLRQSTRRKKTVEARIEANQIVVLAPARLNFAANKRSIEQLIEKIVAKQQPQKSDLLDRAEKLVKRYLPELAGLFAQQMGLKPGNDYPNGTVVSKTESAKDQRETNRVPVEIKWVSNQHTRWGSCSVKTGKIRLSDQLKHMPEWVSDYVLLHELCHLVQPSHNYHFHQLLDRYPKGEQAKGFLTGWVAAKNFLAPPDD